MAASVSLFSLMGKIAVDGVEQTPKDLEEVAKSGKDAESKLTVSFDKIASKAGELGKKVGDLGTKMTLGLTTTIGGLVGMGVNYNVEMETLETNLSTLLGSTEKARAKLEELRTMGSKTPFETTDLVKATQKMLAFGIDADKTNGYLKMLGDISMGDANKLDSLTLAFSQMGASGRASMEDINQMIDQGFNPLTYVTKKTGESMAEVRDRVSEGKVTFEEIAGAMQDATGKGGAFYGSMDKASETTAGKLSTLKDNFGVLVGNLTESVMPIFEKIVNKLAEWVEWFSSLDSGTQEVIVNTLLLVAALGPILIILGKIISSIGAMISVFTKIKTVITTLKTAFAALNITMSINPIGLVIAAVVALVATFVLLWKKCEGFRNFWIGLWKGIKNIAKTVWEAITNFFINAWNKIVEVWSGVTDFFSGVWNGIVTGVTNAWNWVMGLLSTVGTWIYNNVIAPIINYFTNLWNGIVSAYHTVIDPWIEIFKRLSVIIYDNVIKPVADYFTNLWNGIKSGVQSAVNKIKNVFATVANWFNTKVIQPVQNFFKNLWNGIKSGAINVWNAVKNVFSTVANWYNTKVVQPVQKFFGNLWNGFKNGARDAWNSVKSIFSSVTSYFGDIFGKAWNKVKDIFSTGGKIFTGIKEGIVSSFKNIVNGIIGGINKVVAIPFNKINDILNGIRNINILGVQPFTWVGSIGVPQIPQMYEGGILEKGQIGLLEGEGAEAVVPLHNNKKWIRAVADDMEGTLGSSNITDKLDKLISLLTNYLPAMQNQQVVLSTGELVGALTSPLDKSLGELADNRRRGR